ncbi:MAG: PHP domain-containing protein [Ruminococcaceae bacterium]|nr:PHP domain-containing protein [Oscillospiraceae bacterium]
MKKYLLPEDGNYYKANLHAHSTVSDGAYTPAELKELYKSHGYSILALTDHELLVDHSDLDDEDFLTLTSLEYAFIENKPYSHARTIELNMFARDQHNETQVCFDPAYVFHGEKWRVPDVKRVGDIYKRSYKVESIQQVIDEARANGFLVSLNHPGYSMETPEFFGALDGLFAMEIYNHISFIGSGVYDYNPAMYDDMLRRGKRLYCIAADDCHGGWRDESPKCDRYGGFVMIKADELEYSKIISALENGDFYASPGPLIEELYVEDGVAHIRTSAAKYIAMNTCTRPFGGIAAAGEGEYIFEATFKLPASGYFRFDVIDERGRHANTRAYFVE